MYQINNIGEVKNLKRNKLLKPQLDTKWYLVVWLSNKWVLKLHRIHRLVWINFIPSIEWKNYINHKDWNKLNNSIDNLEWCTHKENCEHAVNALHKANYNRMKRVWKFNIDWELIKEFQSIADAFKDSWLKSKTNIVRCLHWTRKSAWWFVYKFI